MSKLEKFLLIVCIMSILALVGYHIKDGFKTYESVVKYADDVPVITVKIDGEVEKPDTYTVVENSRVCDLIYLAGGITPSAYLDGVDPDAILTDGMTITVPSCADNAFIGMPVININKADAEEFMLIPGIGEELAKRITAYREENGNFARISDITRVRGLGDKTFEKIKYYIKTED